MDAVLRLAPAPGAEHTMDRVWMSVVDITDRKRMELALAESEEQYRTLFDSASDAIFIHDLKGNFIRANRTACERLGYSNEELLTMTPGDIDASDHAPQVQERLRLVRENGEFIFESVHRTREGWEIPVEVSSQLIQYQGWPAILSAARDISDRKQAEREIRDREAQFNAILENAPQIVFLKTISGNYLFANRTFEELAGIPARDIVSRTDADLFGIGVAEDLARNDAEVLSSRSPLHFEEKFVVNGRERVFRVVRFLVSNSSGAPYAICGMGADITEQLRARSMREMTARVLDRLNRLGDPGVDIKDILRIIQDVTGLQALGLRVRAQGDFPYAATLGMDPDFIRTENSICASECNGHGDKTLECFCGFVAGGQSLFSDLPGITVSGSLWTNDLPGLPGQVDQSRLPDNIRGRCIVDGFQSVALVPLRAHGEIIGMLHLLDRRPGQLSESLISAFEELGGSIAIALSRFDAEQALRRSREALAVRNEIALSFLTTKDDDIFSTVLDIILKATNSSIGVFGYIDERGYYVCPSMTRGVWDQCSMSDKKLEFAPGEWGGIWGRALKQKTLICRNELFAVPDGHVPVSRAMDVPIEYQGRVIGNFLVANKQSDYTVYDQDLFQTIADTFAPVLHFRLQSLKQEQERRRAEQALERELEATAAIAGLAQAVLSLDDFGDICERALDASKTLTRSQCGYIGTVEPDSGMFACKAMNPDARADCGIQGAPVMFDRCAGLWGWALKNKSAFMSNDPANDSRASGLPQGHIPIENFLAVPALFGNELVGQIAVANSANGYADRDVNFAKRIATIFAIAVQKDRAQRALLESEARFRTISVAAQDAIVMMNSRGEITFWNPAAAELFGYTQEEAVGLKLHGVLTGGVDEQRFLRGLSQFARTGRGAVIGNVMEVGARNKSGREFPAEVSISSIRIGGEWHAVGIIRDITERKRFDQAMRSIVEGTASATGGTFFDSLVRSLSAVLGVKYALVARVEHGSSVAKAVSVWAGDGLAQPMDYDLKGTPCAVVYEPDADVCFYSDDIQRLFHEDTLLVDMGAQSYMGVAMHDSMGAPLGHIAVLDDKPMRDDPGARSIMKIFAARVGAELERLRAEEQLRRHRDDLENTVRRRTAELEQANEQLSALSRMIITMQEEERARLSRELHDQLGQQLTALSLELQWIRETAGQGADGLEPLTGMVSEMATEVRRICKGLRPMILDRMGLSSALSAHIKEFAAHTSIALRHSIEPLRDMDIDSTKAISIFRIMQEALNNAAKYSRADSIFVSFERNDGSLVLTVLDDGVGIDPDRQRHQGLGLAGMRERAALCGGAVEITSARDQGTRVVLSVPVE
jgi:PAS domain S-box-containing protein